MEDLRIGQGVGLARRYPFAVFCFLPLFQRWCLCTFELTWLLLIGCVPRGRCLYRMAFVSCREDDHFETVRKDNLASSIYLKIL